MHFNTRKTDISRWWHGDQTNINGMSIGQDYKQEDKMTTDYHIAVWLKLKGRWSAFAHLLLLTFSGKWMLLNGNVFFYYFYKSLAPKRPFIAVITISWNGLSQKRKLDTLSSVSISICWKLAVMPCTWRPSMQFDALRDNHPAGMLSTNLSPSSRWKDGRPEVSISFRILEVWNQI